MSDTTRARREVRKCFKDCGGALLWAHEGPMGLLEMWLVSGCLMMLQTMAVDGGVRVYRNVGQETDTTAELIEALGLEQSELRGSDLREIDG